MACVRRGQAWLTCVTRDDTVTSALVLAESLRRTRTTRRVGVIISLDVSLESGLTLRRCFDDVLVLDNNLVPGFGFQKAKDDDDLRAKIYAFSLEFFEKCVFIPATAVVLENWDCLFDEMVGHGRYKDYSGGVADLFLFAPKLALCRFLEAGSRKRNGEGNGFMKKSINGWMANNGLEKKTKQKQLAVIVKFSLKSGQLLLNGTGCNQPSLVHLIDVPGTDTGLMAAVNKFAEDPNIGLTEKTILNGWLSIFEELVTPSLADPRLAISRKAEFHEEQYDNEPIAIIGMSCRLPGANNLEEFWNLLHSGQEGINVPPGFRWRREHTIFGGSGKERETNAGFLKSPVDGFDAKFFGVSPKEAVYLDPQARLLHEVIWEGLEYSGIDPLSLRGTHTGIFTGSWMNDYKDIVQASTERDFFRTYMGNSMGATAARLSFLLGLTGPSIATESGCSSAIVAVDLAVQSLRSGDSNLALAGGVNLLLHPYQGNIIDYVIAPNGRCKTFDERADGFGRAEGCGVLVLKRLSDALRDQDHIWAMIRGSAISQEGLSRSLGTPTVHCEALAMQLAMQNAGVVPEQVSFLETHGTGTIVGDPMEIQAIQKAYNTPARKEPLIIGSVKTNVGHTESCSGITGIIKTVLSMQHEVIPKHLNLETLNPEIDLDTIPAKIPLEPVPWPKMKDSPRIAGVSSFGITGTDGHVILQETPDVEMPKFSIGVERPLQILKFSAKSSEALDEMMSNYKDFFGANKDACNLADVAFTCNVGKPSFNHRAFLMASTNEQAEVLLPKKILKGDTQGKEPGKICFLFTGQGSQYAGMAKSLYETSPVFRLHFDQCDTRLRNLYNVSIRKALWDSGTSQDLSRTIYSQTSIFCVEYCLLKLWNSWGLRPDIVLGHSLGEFCAAVAADILSFDDALMLVAERSKLIESLPHGSMLAVKASKQQVEKLFEENNLQLDIAAENTSEQTVIAGNTPKINEFAEVCVSQDIKVIRLEATHAFHSSQMNPILDAYRQKAESVKHSKALGCQYVSGLDGKSIENPEHFGSEYWVRHTRGKVSFLDACKAIKELECEHFIELGPHPVLSAFVLQNIDGTVCYPSLRRQADEWETILNSLGKLYLNGISINWEAFDKPYIRKKIPTGLPIHPFHRKPFWVDCSDTSIAPIHPLIGTPIKNASSLNIFQHSLNVKSLPYLRDHCIGNRIVLPGAAYLEMCLSAGYCVANVLYDYIDKPARPIAIENLTIDLPLELKEAKSCRMQVIVDMPEDDNLEDIKDQASHLAEDQLGYRVKIFRHNNSDDETNGKWVLHAASRFHPVLNVNDILSRWNPDRVKELLEGPEMPSTQSFYKRIDTLGLKFGDSFRSIKKYWGEQRETKDEVVAEIKCPKDYDNYLIHPVVIDAMLQTIILTGLRQAKSEQLSVPVSIGKLIWLGEITKGSDSLYLHASWDESESWCFLFNDDKQTPIAFMSNVQVFETNVKTIESILEQQNSMLPDSWEEIWKPIPGLCDNRIEFSPVEPIVNSTELNAKLDEVSKVTQEDYELDGKINRLIYLYTIKALLQLGWQPIPNETVTVAEFCVKFAILAKHQQIVHFYFTMFHNETGMMDFVEETNSWVVKKRAPEITEIEAEITQLYENLKKNDKVGVTVQIYNHFSQNLVQIWKGETTALELLFPTEPEKAKVCSAERYYQHYPARPDSVGKAREVLRAYLEKLREINGENSKRCLRVLEVGAGTGAMTQEGLPLIRELWGSKFEYYYTDISVAFFAKADKKFEEFKGNLKFNLFDLEKSPLEQGIPLNYFDMVVAADVIHTTKDLEESVRNIRKTLRPKGTLFVNETLIQDRGITFSFGLLDGYWRFTDFKRRPRHACAGPEVWKELICQCGFHFATVKEAYMGHFGIVCAESDGNDGVLSRFTPAIEKDENQVETLKEWIIFGHFDEFNKNLVEKLGNNGNCKVTLVIPVNDSNLDLPCESIKMINQRNESSGEIDALLENDKIYGIVYGWGLNTATRDQNLIALPFMHIAKKLLSVKKPPKLYVLTNGIHPVTEVHSAVNPSAATLFGMVKSLKNENSDMFVRYIDMELDSDQVSHLEGTKIDLILYELAMNKDSREKERAQVAYRGGLRYEPKYNRANARQEKAREELALPHSTDRFHLILPETKMINDLEYDAFEIRPVGETDVEVKVTAWALNFKDVLTILKPTERFKTNEMGLDFSGIITKVGEKVDPEKLKVGDRVFGLNEKDQMPSHVVGPAERVARIPEKMTLLEAVTIPAVFATSIWCLIREAKITADDTILIHTASGGVGLSAIQLANHIGAKIITTAGSPRKRAYLRSLGIQHVFHSRNTSYEKEIMKVTNGRGVDVVLNSITGPGFKEASLAVCAKNARFVEMSKISVWTKEEVNERRPDVAYHLVDLNLLSKEEWMDLWEEMKDKLKEGQVKPIPYVRFDAQRIRQAFTYFQKARHIGKVIVTMPEVKVVKGEWRINVPLFNSDSTYIISGGLGGIGFEVCKWMLSKGATHIVLIGRNEAKPETSKEIERLNNSGKGYQIMVRLGDVGNYEQCKGIVDEIKATCGERLIRGVQHCAGVLRDNLYGNQTWEAFEDVFNPKVLGTWNLHNLTLDCPMEHFVFYSSITALAGTPAQANHSAANCFLDSFTHYRHSLGLPATTINWGQWSQVGVAKEICLAGVRPVSVKRMLNGLETAMRSQRVQISFGEFESMSAWLMASPLFKHYLDDRLLKSLKEGQSNNPQLQLKSDEFWQEMDEAESREEKMEIVCSYMKAILRGALRMEPDEPISEDANMQDLGVDSLMLIELKNSIQSLMGSRLTVTANMLKDCHTIRDLANVIVDKISDDEENPASVPPLSPEEFRHLLEADCILEEGISSNGNTPEPISSLKSVLVTGVTGQLGPYVLLNLCESLSHSLERIALLIRTREKKCPREKLQNILTSMNIIDRIDMSKVDILRGDVTHPKFGLSDEVYQELSESIGGIVHLAVKSHHIEQYRKCESGTRDIRSVNVGGTLNALRFASSGKTKHVYYASSLISIFGSNEEGTLCDNWPEPEQFKVIAENGVGGYPTSKFVSEMLIKQANERGIPCKVFRFPWITGESKTGQLNYLNNHYILRFISYLKIKAMPMAPVPALVLPVDICAEISLKLFLNENVPQAIFNIPHPNPQLEVEFVKVAKKDFYVDLELVDWKSKEFAEKLYATDMPLESLREIYDNVDRAVSMSKAVPFQAVNGYLDSPDNYFTSCNAKLEKYINNYSESIPSSMDIIRKDLLYVKSKGFLDKFGV